MSEKSPKPAPEKNGKEEKPSLEAEVEKTEGKDKEKNQPPEGHPRWDFLYKKSKELEKQLLDEKKRTEDRDKDLDAIREHNRKLEAKLGELEVRKEDKGADPEPDFDEDPKSWRKWKEHQDHFKETERQRKAAVEHLQEQIAEQMDLHEDYDDVRTFMEREMRKDKELEKKIWDAANPALRMYILGRKKLDAQDADKTKADKEADEKDEADRQKRLKAADLESGGGGDDDKEPELSKDQERVIRMMYPDTPYEKAKERYIKQLKVMEAAR